MDWETTSLHQKFIQGTIKSGQVLDLQQLTGVPWINEKVQLSMYTYLPDFGKTKYYAEAVPLGNNKYYVTCRLIGLNYTSALKLSDITIPQDQEWTNIYTGDYYGIDYSFSTTGPTGAEIHRAYQNGNLFCEKLGDANNRIAAYSTTYFNENKQSGTINLQQLGRNYGGKLSNIYIFKEPQEFRELLVNYTVIGE